MCGFALILRLIHFSNGLGPLFRGICAITEKLGGVFGWLDYGGFCRASDATPIILIRAAIRAHIAEKPQRVCMSFLDQLCMLHSGIWAVGKQL